MCSESRTSSFHAEQRTRFVLRDGVLDPERVKAIGERLPADDPQETLSEIKDGLADGSFTICDVVHPDGQTVGWTIYTIIDRPNGKEFLSVASIGQAAENLTAEIIPILEGIAREHHCSTIRLHTLRPGLVKKLFSLGWLASEIVMRKQL